VTPGAITIFNQVVGAPRDDGPIYTGP